MNRKVIQFIGKNQLEIIEEPVGAPGPGQLLVKTTRTMISTGTEGICFTRNFAPGTHWDNWVKYPFRSGYLHVGRVEQVGEGVKDWSVGDRVASRSNHTSHVIVPASPGSGWSSAVRIPANVSDEDATWMGLGKIVQIGVRQAEHKLGDVVAVIGQGLLGQLVVQYCRLMGASEIIAIDTAEKRLAMAAAHGATATLAMTAADALPRVKELSAGAGADVVYDVTGHPAVFAAAQPLVRDHGTLQLLGDAGSPHLQTLTPDIIRRGVRIVGAHDGYPPQAPTAYVRWSGKQMHELFLSYLSRGQMKVSDLVTHRAKPKDAAEVYAMLQRDRTAAMGVVFEWE
jgi:2-desacetyl-2-hydroxyethyl bacteriochlorophyllide A dehydrogenase